MTDLANATEAGQSTRTARVSVVANNAPRGQLAIALLVLVGVVGSLLVILISSGCGPPI
jgi:hypothetical protein